MKCLFFNDDISLILDVINCSKVTRLTTTTDLKTIANHFKISLNNVDILNTYQPVNISTLDAKHVSWEKLCDRMPKDYDDASLI